MSNDSSKLNVIMSSYALISNLVWNRINDTICKIFKGKKNESIGRKYDGGMT
jgi:hypothetical protein